MGRCSKSRSKEPHEESNEIGRQGDFALGLAHIRIELIYVDHIAQDIGTFLPLQL